MEDLILYGWIFVIISNLNHIVYILKGGKTEMIAGIIFAVIGILCFFGNIWKVMKSK